MVSGVDDGSIPASWASYRADDEGTAARRTTLIEAGRLVGFLYDRLCAGKGEADTTGNGRRHSYAHLPIPRMTNLHLLPGDDSPSAIIEDTTTGVYAETLGGGGVNPVTGDFVFTMTSGYMIDHGRLTHPIARASLAGSSLETLSLIDAVADDFQTRDAVCVKAGQAVPVASGSPTLRILRMTVGGTDA
jgi:TldD protein